MAEINFRYRPSRMRRTWITCTGGGLLLAVSLLVAVPAIAEGLLYVAPALLLVLALVQRRYIGEEQIARLAQRLRRPARPRRVQALAPRRAPRVLMPRRGRLLGSSLASRPPPAAALAGA